VFPEPSHTCLSESSVQESSLQIKSDAPFPEPFLTRVSRVSNKGALPPGSPGRAPIERDAPFLEPSFTCLSKSLVKEPPFKFPYGARMPDLICFASVCLLPWAVYLQVKVLLLQHAGLWGIQI
jgi:hypothetical protein